MVPSRATTCSGIVAVRDPDEIEPAVTDAENRPPAPASQIVTTTESDTPIRRSGAGPTSLKDTAEGFTRLARADADDPLVDVEQHIAALRGRARGFRGDLARRGAGRGQHRTPGRQGERTQQSYGAYNPCGHSPPQPTPKTTPGRLLGYLP